jgi:hypothetical protein
LIFFNFGAKSNQRKPAKLPQSKILPASARNLLSQRFDALDLDQIRIEDGIPWYVPMKADAYTNRRRIHFARGKFDPHSLQGIALIAHELAHCEQYQKHGTWRFRLMYLWSWLVNLLRHSSFEQAYLLNRFEIEARAIEQSVCDDLSNRFK